MSDAAVTDHGARKCRQCGCTDNTPCVDRSGFPCSWVADDLCSACLPQEDWMGIMPEEMIHAAFALGEAFSRFEEETGKPLTEEQQQLASFFFGHGFATGAGIMGCELFAPGPASGSEPEPLELPAPAQLILPEGIR